MTPADRAGGRSRGVSYHLSKLRLASLVRTQWRGHFIVYSLHPDLFRPGGPGRAADVIDLGCCRLVLGGERP